MSRTRVLQSVGVVAVLALVAGVVWWTGRGGEDDPGEVAEWPEAPGVVAQGDGVRILLSQGRAEATEQLAVVAGDPLTPQRMAEIIARLNPFRVEPDDQQAFNRPAETLPPPVAGTTIDGRFGVADTTPPATDDGPLEVLRVQPSGDVDLAPFVTVTFDQPMIPLATLDQLDAQDVPVTLEPEVPGRWRWLGTRTLRFEATPGSADRLPMATTFRVVVPAGLTSETGGTLAEDASFSFTTPPPNVIRLTPTGDSMTTTPVWVAVFDQRIDPEAVLDTVQVRAGGRSVGVRLATDDEIAADDTASRIQAQAQPPEGEPTALAGRFVSFTPESPLPTDTAVSIAVGPGTPSAEGPRTTEDAQTFDARTYGTFELRRTDCGGGDECRPGYPFSLEFTNPIDTTRFDPSLIRIDPPVAASVGAYGNIVEISADTAGNTTYEVTVPAGMPDVFGQTLARAETARFDVGDARHSLGFNGRDPLTLDPFAPTPQMAVQVVNHDQLRVQAYSVGPSDWPTYDRFRNSFFDEEPVTPPGRQVLDTTIETDAARGERTEVAVDLAGAFAATDSNQLVVVVESTRQFSRDDEEYWENRPIAVWVQRTTVGVDAFADNERLVVWATDLRDGSPIEGAAIELGGDGTSATTDADGLATFELGTRDHHYLTASKGDDRTMLRADRAGSWRRYDQSDVARWYVFDDRGLYRPGETAHLKGWVRRFTLSQDAQIQRLSPSAAARYTAYDPFGNEIATGRFRLDAAGGFDLAIPIPAGSNLGQAWVELQLEGDVPSSQSHYFHVDEFRRPDFEVATRADSDEPHLFTGHVTTAATAEYYAGGPLPDAPVTWQVTSSSTTYTPPNWSNFTFGIWEPWWYLGDSDPYSGRAVVDDVGYYEEGPSPIEPPFGGQPDVERFEGRTDASGTHYLRLDFSGAAPDQPLLVSANAAVEDVNRQQFASTVDLLVHSGSRYVGLGGDQTFVREGTPLRIETIVTDIDGNAVPGQEVTVVAARLEQQWVTGEGWTEVEAEPQECTITSAAEPVDCEFSTDRGGRYKISSTVTDAAGGQNRTELTRWVSGGDAIPSRTLDQEQLEVVPDAEAYAPGDTAELLVVSPFADGSGLVTVARNGIESSETFVLTDGSAVIEVPVTEASIPGFTVQIDAVGAAPRTRDDGTDDPDLPPRPAFATAQLHLDVPPATRTLTVTPVPRAEALAPGADTAVDLRVTDAAGNPVSGAQAAVVVVDEAVLALTGYTLRDPLEVFYGDWYSELRSDYGRRGVVLARPDSLSPDAAPAPTTTMTSRAAGEGGGADGDDSAQDSADMAEESAAALPATGGSSSAPSTEPIPERTDFDALAVFAPTVTTDADGRATVDVPLPDNLTRYRVMAVAVAGDDRFGSGESTITARLPLSVRPSAPRFLNFGDRFELPVVVQNQTAQDLQVEVVLEATNLDVDGDPDSDPSTAGQLVTVPANDRVEVRFPAEADEAGTARLRTTVVSGDAADSATIELPVYTPATTEAFATYGVIDDGAVAQPTKTPSGVVPQFGGLEISTSATILQTLTDAVLYVVEYEYDSADALASRVLSIAALRDVFDAFDVAGVPSTAELNTIVENDLERLAGLQNDDGGWSWWRRYQDSVPHNTIHVAHALVAARSAGYAVPADMLERAMEYLRTIESRYPADYSEHTRHVLSAYAVHVRDLAGERDPAKALDLYDNGDLPLDASAWLWPVLDDQDAVAEIERTLDTVVVETPSAATFTTGIEDGRDLLLASDRRTDGIVLDAMVRVEPDNDLVPKIVQGLIGNQRQGRWNNIQENAFILLALKRYFDTYESQTPDFAARVWVGERYAAAHEYRGYTIDSQRSTVPMDELVDPLRNADPDIVVAKDGTGRLYYRLGLDYAPADLTLPARDEGFVVEREYEAVGDSDDVRRDADGTWRIRAGAEVRVRLSMVADSRRVNMALVDHLPAGLEIVNTELATSPATLPEDQAGDDGGDGGDGPEPFFGDDWWFPGWYWRWFDHQNLRDDRAEAFAAWLPAGTYDWSYVARATTTGTFTAPPAKAEEIYSPEVFGRTATDTVVVSEADVAGVDA